MRQKVDVSERAIDEAIADLSAEFAREAGAFADVFESWRKPEVAREVVESLLNNDGDAFNALLQPKIDRPGADPDRLDPSSDDPEVRRIALCYKLLLLAEKLGRPKFLPGTTETCRLRTDLSPNERRRYLALATQFRDVWIWEDGAARGLSGIGLEGPVIPAGPFLDALKAEGLVNCVQDETVLQLDPRSGVFRGLSDVCGFQL